MSYDRKLLRGRKILVETEIEELKARLHRLESELATINFKTNLKER